MVKTVTKYCRKNCNSKHPNYWVW